MEVSERLTGFELEDLMSWTVSNLQRPFILKPVKKLEKLFIAPKVRQVLYETSQRVFTRCACAQRTGFLIKFFNQESV